MLAIEFGDPAECRCECHDEEHGKNIRHIEPCCYQCTYCKKNIKVAMIQERESNCPHASDPVEEISLCPLPFLLT